MKGFAPDQYRPYNFPNGRIQFTALVLGGKKIRRHTELGVYEYKFYPRLLKDGFYVFEAQRRMTGRAEMVRLATMEERDAVMKGVPVVNAVTSMWNEGTGLWYCHPLNTNQAKKYKNLHFPVPLRLPTEELSILQPIQAWVYRSPRRQVLVFNDLHLRYPTLTLDIIRPYVDGSTTPTEDAAKALFDANHPARKATPEEHAAFSFAYKSTKPPIERLIEETIHFVGAELQHYEDLGNGQYEVTWKYKGQTDHVTINKQMAVIDAHMCLVDRSSGRHYQGHRDYDLGSMILVKREGRRKGY